MSQIEIEFNSIDEVDERGPDFNSYDHIIVAFSGGKDSTACFLHLVELGVDLRKVEFWHHEIDGREGSQLMDWVCTPDYCRKFAAQFNVPIYFSWREGGFETEMLRDGTTLTGPVHYENADGYHKTTPGKGYAKRLRFPQTASIVSGRWCSPKLKIDVGRSVFTNDPRFQDSKTLFITGERAEESLSPENYELFLANDPNVNKKDRAGYEEFEIMPKVDKRATGRHIDVWRPVHRWSVKEVWAISERHNVRAHPCYYLGFSRCSCEFCIFGNADQWATGKAVSPARCGTLVQYEKDLDNTIDQNMGLEEKAAKGQVYSGFSAEYARVANSKEYEQTIIMNKWFLPAGAFGKSCGPS